VPDELRQLFELAWDDLEDEGGSEADPVTVALAMAEVFTGIALTSADFARIAHSSAYLAPSLVYPD
jgi:hypothetical protein